MKRTLTFEIDSPERDAPVLIVSTYRCGCVISDNRREETWAVVMTPCAKHRGTKPPDAQRGWQPCQKSWYTAAPGTSKVQCVLPNGHPGAHAAIGADGCWIHLKGEEPEFCQKTWYQPMTPPAPPEKVTCFREKGHTGMHSAVDARGCFHNLKVEGQP